MIHGPTRNHGLAAGLFRGFRTKIFRNISVRTTPNRHSFGSSSFRMRMNMRIKALGSLAALSLLLAGVKPLVAHHSFDAEYDSKKTTTITGYVTKLDWVNPHAFVFIDIKDETGVVKNFKVEMGPPYALTRGGWKRDSIKIGDKVTVQAAALAKDGSNAAGSEQTTFMILSDGQKLPMR